MIECFGYDVLGELKVDIQEFIGYYHTGEYIYQSVLRRHFKDKAEEVKRTLVDNGYAILVTGYRCPECNHFIGNSSQESYKDMLDTLMFNGDMLCYSCESLFSPKNIIEEPLLIRTEKQVDNEKED